MLQAVAEWPECARAYMERGALRLALQQWEAAVEDLTQALKVQGGFVAGTSRAFMCGRCSFARLPATV